MKAGGNTAAEMRAAFAALTQPSSGPAQKPLRQTHRHRRFSARPGSQRTKRSDVDRWTPAAFHIVQHARAEGAPVDLFPCTVNGEPSAVIAIYEQRGSQWRIQPLFVAFTEGMTLGQRGDTEDEGEGGGPKGEEPSRRAARHPPASSALVGSAASARAFHAARAGHMNLQAPPAEERPAEPLSSHWRSVGVILLR